MLKFLGILFFGVLFVFLILGVFLGRAIRSFSSSNKTKNNRQTNYNPTPDASQKKFSKDEGEYVNYEEIKEDE